MPKYWRGDCRLFSNKILLFVVVPILLIIFVWPKTVAIGNENGTVNWFNWVKTYSALAGCIGFMLIRYIPKMEKSKLAFYFPPLILAYDLWNFAYTYNCIADRSMY